MSEDNTLAHSVSNKKVGRIRIQESTGRGSKSTPREKVKRHKSTQEKFSIFSDTSLFHIIFGRAFAFMEEMRYGSLVSFGHFLPMNRFSLLESLLSPEQVSALRAVQSGLERDPTCLDRVNTETVPNCYTEGASLSSSEEKNDA